MLVALPASVAFGVTIYAAIAPHYAAFGALAGVLEAMALGLIAPTFGGTDRLDPPAPCAPAAAVLSTLRHRARSTGRQPDQRSFSCSPYSAFSPGLLQILIGLLGVGRLIKFIPYPVVSGYLSGVGLIIIGSQLPKLVGAADGTRWYRSSSRRNCGTGAALPSTRHNHRRDALFQPHLQENSRHDHRHRLRRHYLPPDSPFFDSHNIYFYINTSAFISFFNNFIFIHIMHDEEKKFS